MKKILFLAGTLAVIFACSTENETEFNQDQNQPTEKVASKTYSLSDSEIDNMFHEYINSADYINLKSANQIFNTKLNSLGEAPSFNTEANFLSWIELNIDQTDFVNMGQVLSEWNNIKALHIVVENEFPQIFDFIVHAPEDIVNIKLTKWLINHQTTISNTCREELQKCYDRATSSYQSSMRFYDSIPEHADNLAWARANATRSYIDSTFNCLNNFLAC